MPPPFGEQQDLRNGDILRRGDLDVSIVPLGHVDLTVDRLDQLAVIGEIQGVFLRKGHCLKVQLPLEHLGVWVINRWGR